MLLVLFALSVAAQQSGGGFGGGFPGSSFGAGTSAAQSSQSTSASPSRTQPQPGPDTPSGPSIFELRQADRNVWINQAAYRGDNVIYNVPLGVFGIENSPSFLGNIGRSYKADSAAQQQQYFQREINHLRATTPRLTWEDRNKIDDFALQRDAAYNTKLRRVSGILPFDAISFGGGSISSVFDVKAKQLTYNLAENGLFDARRAYAADPSRENLIALRNAQDGVLQADHRQDASTYDLLGGGFGGAFRFGPVFRKKASETKLDTGMRNLRVARQEYAQNPTQDNYSKLRLADLFVRATEEEDESNKNDIVTSLLVGDLSSPGDDASFIWNTVMSGKNAEDESRLWLRYARLERENLQRQRAEFLQSESSPVASQMLGLSMYGPRQLF